MSKSEQNLKDAFAGESQANRKYLAFAKKADQEGHKQVAKLFRAAGEAETVHAHAHLRALKGIGSTADNLKEAISGDKGALQSFQYANAVEKVHAGLYQKALEKMDKLEETDYWVCSVCGYTCEGEAPDECPVCKAKKKAFFKVD
jgi:rubrerythrin